jgi:hypothetical protein
MSHAFGGGVHVTGMTQSDWREKGSKSGVLY